MINVSKYFRKMVSSKPKVPEFVRAKPSGIAAAFKAKFQASTQAETTAKREEREAKQAATVAEKESQEAEEARETAVEARQESLEARQPLRSKAAPPATVPAKKDKLKAVKKGIRDKKFELNQLGRERDQTKRQCRADVIGAEAKIQQAKIDLKDLIEQRRALGGWFF